MTAKSLRAVMALVVTAAAASANAQYKCNEPQLLVDQRACEAARKGPEDLRLFIQRMESLRISLHYADYVDRNTLVAWEEMRARSLTASMRTTAASRRP